MEDQEDRITMLQVMREETAAEVMACVDMDLLDLIYKLLLDSNRE